MLLVVAIAEFFISNYEHYFMLHGFATGFYNCHCGEWPYVKCTLMKAKADCFRVEIRSSLLHVTGHTDLTR